VAKVRERQGVEKGRLHTFYMERLNIMKLNEVEGKEQYCVEASEGFAALEDLDTEVDISGACGMIRENIKSSARESLGNYELKKHKSWSDEDCSN
jgi:hypothetical protein